VETALKLLGALGMLKNITDVMARDDAQGKPWITDPAFHAVLAGAVLYVAGLGFSSANKKLVGAITEWVGAAISTCPAADQLRNDWAAPPGPARDQAIKADILALIKQLALLLLPIIGMARGIRETGETTRPAGRELTDTEKADAYLLGQRTKSVLTALKEELKASSPKTDLPPREFDAAIDKLSEAVPSTTDPEIQNAARRLLGDGKDPGSLEQAADALRVPDNYAKILSGLEERRLAMGQPKTIDGYIAAAVELARERGKTVYEIYVPEDKSAVMLREYGSQAPGTPLVGGATDPQTGLVDPDVFMERLSGRLFVDNAFEGGQGQHGNMTHLIQYLVLDNYFSRTGGNVDAFFGDLNAVSRSLKLSDELWVGVLDPMLTAHIAQPETIWQRLRDVMLANPPP
jgi:hypothetical protein